MSVKPVGIQPYVTIASAAGASNICTLTITAVDAYGTAIERSIVLDVWCSDNADGEGHTAETPSGEITAVTGVMVAAYLVTKVHWRVMTDENGVFVGSFTDTGVPTAGYYIVVQDPRTGAISVSDNIGSDFGA